jgi:hypothetical protein
VASHTSAKGDNEKTGKQPKWRIAGLIKTSTKTLERILIMILIVAICFKLKCHIIVSLIASREVSDFRPRPVMIQATAELESMWTHPLRLEANPVHFIEKRKNRYWMRHRVYELNQVKGLDKGCVALGDWMNDIHPSCNIVHEIDTTDFFMNRNRTKVLVNGAARRKRMFYVGSGAYRDAFMFTDYDGSRRLLKRFRWADNLNIHHQSIDKMRRDAVAMEQLTGSSYVADIYAYCSVSSLVDYSNEQDLSEIFDGKKQPTKDELFRISYDVAASVVDAHHPNAQGQSTIAHLDIKPDQWIRMNGKYLFQDFNLARFLSWNPKRQENCGWSTGWKGGRYHAPEQYTKDVPLTDKADVYALGAVLSFLLTKRQPFQGKERWQVTKILSNGGVLKLTDPVILNSTHPFDVTVRQVVQMCLAMDPDERPSARDVADFIGKGLAEREREHKRGEYL